MKKEFSLFAIFIVAGLLAWIYWSSFAGKRQQPLTGTQAPVFSVTALDGETYSVEDAIKNRKVTLINFWATHCAPCREEMPVLESLYKAMDPAWFSFVSINEDGIGNRDELKAVIEKFKKRVPFTFPVYVDNNFFAADLFGTTRIPETFVIDSEGKIAYELRGLMTEQDKKDMIKLLQGLEPKNQ